ncbi:EAL domain-containing protein [Arthrobacter sp. NPDC058130]|uniref:sensor domain-containing phosphodiesterase n=1 Tax=Arthrobacter sp. NPDC058130 TaxID=3346353 RepID=UPI0036DFA6E6
MTAGAVLILDPVVTAHPGLQLLLGSLITMPILIAGLLALRFHRCHRAERAGARDAAQLMDTVLTTSHEWLWALDAQGNFTFSSPTSTDLTGYHPSELVGKHFSIVVDVEHVPEAIRSLLHAPAVEGRARGIVRCRHRDGSTVWIESSAHNRSVRVGQPPGLEGTSRRVPVETAREASTALSRTRIRAVIDGNKLLTAFQPIHNLAAGHIIGAEALTRFLSEDGPECWFNEAAAVGLSEDLEIAALETALKAAQGLPPSMYVALNVSPSTCLDPRLPGILERSGLALQRVVLELTERLEVEEYRPLISALEPLRRRGLRIAIDDAGSGFASMRHVLHIRPDIIKLDRTLITGIHDDEGRQAFGAAMAEFARRLGATLVAEGIETEAELAAVTELGMTAGQGYLLGRPTIDEHEWENWRLQTWAPSGRFN